MDLGVSTLLKHISVHETGASRGWQKPISNFSVSFFFDNPNMSSKKTMEINPEISTTEELIKRVDPEKNDKSMKDLGCCYLRLLHSHLVSASMK